MRTPIKAVFFNAPPRAGKDTACQAVENHFLWKVARRGVFVPYPAKFAEVLKQGAHALFGFPKLPADAFESVKDKPAEQFFSMSPRQVYIALSEAFMKPVFGNDIFGRIFARRIIEQINQDFAKAPDSATALILCSDSGFKEEIGPILDRIGRDNALIVQITREGCSFKNDSRSFIEIEGVTMVQIHNTDLEKFRADVVSAVTTWLESSERKDG